MNAKVEYVAEQYINDVEDHLASCASFSGVVHATFKPGVSMTPLEAIEAIRKHYPSFERLPVHAAVIDGGVIAFSHAHPDFVGRLKKFDELEGADGYGLAIIQPGSVGLHDIPSRAMQRAKDLLFTEHRDIYCNAIYVRMLERDYMKGGGEAIEISYSRRFKMVTVAVPECLIVEFRLGD
jgi:hypothetical protein